MSIESKCDIHVNGEPLSVSASMTVQQLLAELDLRRRGIAVEINNKIVPRDQFSVRQVIEGDWLEIVSLVGGG